MIKIASGYPVDECLNQLDANPYVWDKYIVRTQLYDNSPHREVSDIWIRYNHWNNFDPGNPSAFNNEHYPIWYEAAYQLPAVKTLILSVFDTFKDSQLGGCLITKIPPGGKVYPHADTIGWHTNYFTTKYLLLLQSAPGQSFNFENESHEGISGDLFSFNNHHTHWVDNNSDIDRISLIFAVRHGASIDEQNTSLTG